jgi:tetratricopeptide (TPR) repeat protein
MCIAIDSDAMGRAKSAAKKPIKAKAKPVGKTRPANAKATKRAPKARPSRSEAGAWQPTGKSWGADSHFARALELERAGKLVEARDAWLLAIREEDGGTGAELRLLEVLGKLGDDARVLELADKLEARGVGGVVLHTRRARALSSTGRPSEAVASARKAIETDPEYAAGWFALEEAHRGEGDRAAAAIAANEVVRLAPAWALGWFLLAGDLKAIGRYEDAVAAVTKATELEPADGDGWYNLACYQALLGRDVDALAALETAIRCDPENAAIALRDEDFVSLRADPRFRVLCGAS